MTFILTEERGNRRRPPAEETTWNVLHLSTVLTLVKPEGYKILRFSYLW